MPREASSPEPSESPNLPEARHKEMSEESSYVMEVWQEGARNLQHVRPREWGGWGQGGGGKEMKNAVKFVPSFSHGAVRQVQACAAVPFPR